MTLKFKDKLYCKGIVFTKKGLYYFSFFLCLVNSYCLVPMKEYGFSWLSHCFW